jgi:hypothetical protein
MWSVSNCLLGDSSPTAWVRNDSVFARNYGIIKGMFCQILHLRWGSRMTIQTFGLNLANVRNFVSAKIVSLAFATRRRRFRDEGWQKLLWYHDGSVFSKTKL